MIEGMRLAQDDINSPAGASAQVAEMTESEAVARASQGSADAFEWLYRAHVSRIFGLATRMVDVGAAEDLTQEVFIRAWQKLPSFRAESSFGTWLYRLAINWILTRRKAMSRDAERRLALVPPMTPKASSSRPARSGDRIDLERALDTLPPGARQVFVLHDVEGYQHKEIAEFLEISSGTSKSQLHRARMLLREYLR